MTELRGVVLDASALVEYLRWSPVGQRVAEDLPATRHPVEPFLPRIWELRGNLTADDATYVALAEALGVPLWTADRR